MGGFRTAPVVTEGQKVRLRAETFADHYSQARLFYRSPTEIEQAHLASALVFELSKCNFDHVRARVLSNLGNVDADLRVEGRRHRWTRRRYWWRGCNHADRDDCDPGRAAWAGCLIRKAVCTGK